MWRTCASINALMKLWCSLGAGCCTSLLADFGRGAICLAFAIMVAFRLRLSDCLECVMILIMWQLFVNWVLLGALLGEQSIAHNLEDLNTGNHLTTCNHSAGGQCTQRIALLNGVRISIKSLKMFWSYRISWCCICRQWTLPSGIWIIYLTIANWELHHAALSA